VENGLLRRILGRWTQSKNALPRQGSDLIAQAQPAGVPLAERAVDEYLALAKTDQGRTGLLLKLQNDLPVASKPTSPMQMDFLNLVLDFTDNRMREIRERNAR
jgi:hypothetical protein